MARNAVLLVALVLYAAVLGCAVIAPTAAGVSAESAPPRHPTSFRSEAAEGLPYRAVGIQLQRVDWIDKYKQAIDNIADIGADAVKFVVEGRQENGSSSRIFIDMRMTPTPDQIGELVTYAKKRKLRVIMMPIVLLDAPRGNEWRGRIAPESWDEWWESYRAFLHHYSWIAQSYGVDVLVVGSELVSTESQTDQWRKTIDGVRVDYKGKLTYSSNWDHYTAIHFWDQLDFIGMNSYWTLGKNRDVSVAEIKSNWAKIQAQLFAFQKTVGKPIFLLEVGWCSMANMAYEPWDYTKDKYEAPTDPELQRKLYEGFFESWYGRPELGGFSIWEWKPGEGGVLDRGYTPAGKPAEQVLRQWLAKPWNEDDKPATKHAPDGKPSAAPATAGPGSWDRALPPA